MNSLAKTSIMLASLLGGCLPLEQAPLVYSSKNQIGVGVAAGTPDSPGLDVNIGYKSLDAAFVPVAVAKRCPNDRCTGIDYNIRVVEGANRQSGQRQSDKAEIRRLQDAIASAEQQAEVASQRIALGSKTLAELGTLEKNEARLAELQGIVDATAGDDGTPAPTLDAAQVNEKADLDSRLPAIRANKAKQPSIEAELAQQNAVLNKAKEDAKNARGSLDQLLARKDIRNDDDKADAYSVYGSFNGDALGDAKGAGLKLGKVFSTGIAAQNVSQGIRHSARMDAVAKCLVAAKTLIGASTDDKLIGAAIASCHEPESID